MDVWKLTFNQYLDYYINNSKYKNKILENKTQYEATKNICLQKWINELFKRAEVGSIPEIVIRSYIKIFDINQLKINFRGIKQKGLQEWEETQKKKQYKETIKENYKLLI